MPGSLFLFVILARLIWTYSRKNKSGARPPIPWFTARWWLIAIFLGGGIFVGSVAVLASVTATPRQPPTILFDACVLVGFVAVGAPFFFPWLALMRVAKLGNPRRAYYLAHAFRFSYYTAEPHGAACFCAALAIARRGAPTRAELDWIQTRLAKETRALGIFGAALALTQALEGRLAEDEGRHRDADEFRDRARILFGTTTYLSKAAIPRAIRIFANEYLALDSATRGEWGALESVEPQNASPIVRALRGWSQKNLLKSETKEDWRTRRAATLPIAEALATRADHERKQMNADQLFARMNRDYVALLKGRRMTPRAILNLLTALDIFFDVRSPECRLPPELRSDEEAIAEVGDAIAGSVFEALPIARSPCFCA